jgi:GT2 family glycosyltransferase
VTRAPGWVPLGLTLAEVRGAAAGPWRLLQSSRQRRAVASIEPSRSKPMSPPLDRKGAVEVDAEAPRLTVAVASHQRRESLRRVLLALAGQEFPAERFEVVVVLDGSTDDSAAMARSLDLPYRLRVVEQPNSGLAATRDRGAREATEDVVVFLDDDVDPEPGFLAAHAAAHRRTSGSLVALGYYPPASAPDSLWSMRLRAWWEDHFRRLGDPDHQWTYTDLVDGNSSVRPSLLFEVGGYDERFRGSRRQDWELGIRMLQRGVRLEYHPAAKGLHRLDTSLARGLRNAREEGRWDVLVGEKHPQTKGHLPLARLAGAFERRPRRAKALHHPLARRLPIDVAGIPMLKALEACRLQGRWRRLLDMLLIRSYALGVLDAIPETEQLREYLDAEGIRESTEHLELDLDDPAPLTVPAGAGAIEVTICSSGQPLAAITGMDTGGQWDWEALVERAVDFAAESAQLRLGIRGLDEQRPRHPA